MKSVSPFCKYKKCRTEKLADCHQTKDWLTGVTDFMRGELSAVSFVFISFVFPTGDGNVFSDTKEGKTVMAACGELLFLYELECAVWLSDSACDRNRLWGRTFAGTK